MTLIINSPPNTQRKQHQQLNAYTHTQTHKRMRLINYLLSDNILQSQCQV